ncbi:PKS16 protein [Massariosphaeria phaeospora]|uniref:PKS16 protein n=1 Tax=Massariosphaeria phaeospora TaxID=100035 RepID=A0A7C8MYP5_9PLEO|nr:PKS16 protein [Massariosphaeria phaeospora]
MKPINLVLFGDQTVEKRSSIQALVRHSKSSTGARRLLQEATDLVQLHFGQLSKEDRAWDHEIHTLLGLAEDNASEQKPNGVVATILMCIGRLGELIVHAEEDASILGSENDPVQVLAFCTGLLPAAALVAARDTNELFELATELISITLRMCIAMQRRMNMIEDTNLSWATTILGATPDKVQPILEEFHEVQNIPYPKRIAIGVISAGWLTLIGAPSSLGRLMKFSKDLDEAPKMKTNTNGVVHTPYIPIFDLDTALGSSPLLDLPITSKARILSPASCKPYPNGTLRALLSEILPDIAQRALRVDDTASACISGFAGSRPVSLTVMGPTGNQSAVEQLLKSHNVEYQINQHHRPEKGIASRGGSDMVAIVGMSARLPGSDTVEAFFETLLDGKIQIDKIPNSRFDIDKYYDPTGKRRNTTSTNQAACLERPGYFDNRLFNVSPREALQMDPLQRMLLTTSWEALEMAGYSKNATPSTQSNRIATYFGQAAEDWREVLNNDEIDIYYVPGLSRAFGPSRLAYYHKWGGGTYALDAACATSTTAIHLACKALSTRECDTALAGGGSLTVSPTGFAGLSRSGMTSNNGGCRTFHDDADGYARGEGIGVVVLKRLEDAVADNDNVLGVIRGHARTYTSTSTSITHPSAESQSRLYEEILRQTSVVPNEIAYVEMHGTGTQAGDFEEMSSVIRVLGPQRSKKNILTVGAVKANIGHGEAAAGVTSLIKVLMMLREKKIPAQPGLPFKLNHHFPKLDNAHIRIAGIGGKDLTLRPSPTATDGKIKCLVSSFDASGGNTGLVVEEAPDRPMKEDNPLPAHVVTLSARTPASLQQNRKRLLDYLMRHPETKLADLAYTTTARRMHEVLRGAHVGTSTRDIITSLREDVMKEGPNDPKKKAPSSNVVFAFTGQGSQYAGMGRQLYQHSSAFRELLRTLQQVATYQNLPQFLHIITDEQSDITSSSTVVVQLAIVALEIAIAQLLQSWGVAPGLVIGHSLGEYSALCVAGVLSGSDTMYLVGRRAQLLEQKLAAGQYAMLAVNKDVEATRELLTANTQFLNQTGVACINAPQRTVVSGPVSEIEHLKNLLEKEGARGTILRTAYGFHSHHVDPILSELETIAKGVSFSHPTIPVASTLLGRVVEAGEPEIFSPNYLVRQTREFVNFTGALQAFESHSLAKARTNWIEIGPEPVCVGLARKTLSDPLSRFLPIMKPTEDNWVTISSTLASLYQAGASINWPQYHRNFQSSLSLLPLPTYAFDEKDYWMPYVEWSDPTLTSPLETGKNVSKSPSGFAFSTTSLQWIEDEVIQGTSVSVTFASRTSEPKLYDAIQGHVVNGVTIVSLSIFCDMAQSAAHYAYQKLKPGSKAPSLNIHDVEMSHALIVPELDPTQIVHTTITLSDGGVADVHFSSTKGSSSTEHGLLRVAFEDNRAWFAKQSQLSFLINARIQTLKDMSSTGKAHRLLKPVAYKLFDSVVSYGKNYQAMEEVWIDGEYRDAVGTIKLPNTVDIGNFMHNPFWSDGIIHLSGFLVNGGLKYPEDTVCLSTGFASWRSLESLHADETYTTYTTIQEAETPNILLGSAYVYNSRQKLVQVTTDIRFQKMKRIVLNSLLGIRPAPASAVPSATDKAVAWSNSVLVSNSKLRSSTGMSTPATQVTDLDLSEREGQSGTVTPASSVSDDSSTELMSKLLSIVVSESGCKESELEPSTSFADIGMDSLMAITIIATLQRETGLELPPTFFLEHQTVAEAKDALPGGVPAGDTPAEVPRATSDKKAEERVTAIIPSVPVSEASSFEISPDPQPRPNVEDVQQTPQSAPPPVLPVESNNTSKTVLLQSATSSTGSNLFLLPDGGGSPSRYIQLPPLGSDINVYGLESPFIKAPASFTCSIEAICALFLGSIKDIQPTGPYFLGGFSLGALYAYEIARMLGERGESVEGLFIIDMAVPRTLGITPSITQQQLAEAGLLPTVGRLTATQKEHFVSTVRAMMTYSPTACPHNQSPKRTVLVSSKHGLAAGKLSDLAVWAQSSTSAARGWQDLVGDAVEHKELDAEHFALFRHPTVESLGKFWADAFAKF